MRLAPRRAALRSLTRWPLWAKPALAIVSALALGLVLSSIEVAPDSLLGRLVFSGSASDARQLLATVTSTMITVTSVVFVLTVVALQIASTQFSPRLLRSFLRDSGTQLVLSTFVGTVAYSLAGLYTVAMLVYYIQHITNGIRIDTIMGDIAAMTLHVVRTSMPLGPPDRRAIVPSKRPAHAATLVAPASGYVERIDVDAVAPLALRDEATVVFTAMTGFHVTEGRPVGWVAAAGAGVNLDAYQRAVGDAMVIDRERKIEHDVGFGLRQLVDIAGRGLSPSLNDPYSAVQAIHHATVVLTECPAVTSSRSRSATPPERCACSRRRWISSSTCRPCAAMCAGPWRTVRVGQDVAELAIAAAGSSTRYTHTPVEATAATEAMTSGQATDERGAERGRTITADVSG